MKRKAFMLIAGEASGDLLAAELVKALKESPEVQAMPFPPEFFGAGGPQMAEAGVELAIDLTKHSVIGLFDALKKYSEYKRFFGRLFKLALEREPDAIICVDFSGFNRRFAHAIKRHVRARRSSFNNWNPKIVQYVSPQVWASRPGRAYQIAEDVDLLLSIFPFEKKWYAKRVPELRVEFVGHPMVDRFEKPEIRNRKSEIPRSPPLILLLPGSRAGELQRHWKLLLTAAVRIANVGRASFRAVLPTRELADAARTAEAIAVAEFFHDGEISFDIQVGGLEGALAQADLAITKSGTITLECALFGVPAVVFYKTSWISYLTGKMAINVEHLAMPNLLAGEEVYPEFIQHTATPENIARAALGLLNNQERRTAAKAKLARVVKSLGETGASERAATAVLSLLE